MPPEPQGLRPIRLIVGDSMPSPESPARGDRGPASSPGAALPV